MATREQYEIGQAPKTTKTNPNGKDKEGRARDKELRKMKQAQGLDANQPFPLPAGQDEGAQRRLADDMQRRQQENFKMMQDAGALGGIKKDTGSNLDYLRPRSEQAEINQGAQAAGRQKQQDTFARGRAAVAEGKQAQYMRNSENAENVAMRGRFTEDGVTNFFNDRQGAAADVAGGGRPQSDMRTMVLPDGSLGMGVSPGQRGLQGLPDGTQLPTGSGVPMSSGEAFNTGQQGSNVFETDRSSATSMDAADARQSAVQQGIRDQMGSFQFDGSAEVPYAPVPGEDAPMGVPAASSEQAPAPTTAPTQTPGLAKLPGAAADPTDNIRQMMQNGEDPTATIDQMLDMGMITPEQAYEYEDAWLAGAGLLDLATEPTPVAPATEQPTQQAEALAAEQGVEGVWPHVVAFNNRMKDVRDDLVLPFFMGPKDQTVNPDSQGAAANEAIALRQAMTQLRGQPPAAPTPSPVPGSGQGIPENPPEQIPVPGTEGTTFEGTLEQLPARVQSGEMTLGEIDHLLRNGTISVAQADVLEALALILAQQ